MSGSYRPAGHGAVSPYLIVDGAARAIDFLQQVFGATELRRFADESGGIVHAEIRLDDAVVMLADATADWPPVPAHVHVYVPDVDATYAAALDAGAESVQPPMKRDDADRRGGVKDPSGTTWWIATRVE